MKELKTPTTTIMVTPATRRLIKIWSAQLDVTMTEFMARLVEQRETIGDMVGTTVGSPQ